jgi:hypothetical protein
VVDDILFPEAVEPPADPIGEHPLGITLAEPILLREARRQAGARRGSRVPASSIPAAA